MFESYSVTFVPETLNLSLCNEGKKTPLMMNAETCWICLNGNCRKIKSWSSLCWVEMSPFIEDSQSTINA